MENKEEVIKVIESNITPKPIIVICLINFIYLGYVFMIQLALSPYFESKSLMYFALFMPIIGIISNIGLLSMKQWALYAYTITCIINLYTFIAMGNRNTLSIIMCIVVLLVIWSYKDKMVGKNHQIGDEQNEINREEQNETANIENELNNSLEKEQTYLKKPNQTNRKEIKAEYLAKIFNAWKLIKEWLYTNRNKLVVPVLCLWSFIHTYLIVKSHQFEYVDYQGLKLTLDGEIFSASSKFYPFTSGGSDSIYDVRYYDFTEYFVYVGGVWMIYFLCRYLKGNKAVGKI